jgi:serine/threonine protein kinase
VCLNICHTGLSLSLVQLFLRQVLDSLAVLRDASIIHCDLKVWISHTQAAVLRDATIIHCDLKVWIPHTQAAVLRDATIIHCDLKVWISHTQAAVLRDATIIHCDLKVWFSHTQAAVPDKRNEGPNIQAPEVIFFNFWNLLIFIMIDLSWLLNKQTNKQTLYATVGKSILLYYSICQSLRIHSSCSRRIFCSRMQHRGRSSWLTLEAPALRTGQCTATYSPGM